MAVRLNQPPRTLGDTPEEMAWLEQLARVVNASVGSGTTANRPTTFLYAFRPYGDTTLGKMIWRNAANTAWIDATGATV